MSEKTFRGFIVEEPAHALAIELVHQSDNCITIEEAVEQAHEMLNSLSEIGLRLDWVKP